MKTLEITGTVRETLGKTGTKKVRYSGKIPAVIYGEGNPQHIALEYIPLDKALHSPDTYLVKLNVGGSVVDAILREVQYHPVTDRIVHADFLRVSADKEIELELPIKLTGNSEGVRAGGKLVPLMRKLKVRGLLNQLPDVVNVDITDLGLGKTLKVSDINLAGIAVTSPPNAGIAIVEIPRTLRTGGEG